MSRPKFLKLLARFKALARHLYRLWKACWLPITLIFCFVLQNYFFNAWLGIGAKPFLVRRAAATAACGLLLFGPAMLLGKRMKYPYLGLASLLAAFIFIAEFLYYSYSGGFLQVSAFFYTSEGITTLSTAKLLLTYSLLFFLAGPLLVALIWLLVKFRLITDKRLSGREKIVAGILILIFAAAGYSYFLNREYRDNGSLAQIYQYDKLYNVNDLVSKMGVVNFLIGDALRLGIMPQKVNADEISSVEKYSVQHPAAPAGSDFGLLKGRNLIIIQVESLENAVINQKIAGQEITPNLNRLAAQGLYFSNYYSPIGPGTTADAEFMTLDSLYSLPDTVAFIKYPYDNYNALPELLADNGYHTYAFHGDVSSFWNRANIYPRLGYEKWFSRDDYNIPRKIGAFDLGDRDFFEQSISKLQALPQPFMATLITLSSHTPFQLPDDLETLPIPSTGTFNWLQYEYLESIHYTDSAIGEFITQLQAAGLYDNSLIMIFGDHGSFTNISSALGFNNSVFPNLQTIEVPLIVLAPGTSLQGNKAIPSGQLDLYPTAADLLGFQPPADIFGHDIVEGKDPVTVSRNLVSGTVKSIVTDKLAYQAAADGTFTAGTCLAMPSQKALPVDNCKLLYDNEENAVETSDLMIKGDLFNEN